MEIKINKEFVCSAVNFKLDLQYITKYFNCKCVFLFSGSQTLPLVHFQKEYMHSVDGKIGIPKAETQKSALKYGDRKSVV